MARKGNNPGKMDTEKETGSKRRYQSPQTPPQAPRSSPRTQQGREQGRGQEERQQDDQDFDTEDFGEGQATGRGTSQEYGQGQRQGRGLTEDREQGAQGARVGGQESRQDWQDDIDEDGITGGYAARGSDFDLQKASRDELNAIAQELDIEDYETMNREELVMEIRERS
jgi:hypothetical protein